MEMQRPAGWSLQIRQDELNERLLFSVLMMIAGGVIFSLVATSANKINLPTIVFGIIYSSIMAWRTGSVAILLGHYTLGLRGEQLVGQALDRLSSRDFQVFHDFEVKENGKKSWNIDHIVVSTAGIFAIETKMRRKPQKTGENEQAHKVVYDGKRLNFPSPLQPDSLSIEQALGNAHWLSKLLSRKNAADIPVIPVLILPGWWVETKARGEVAVLNPKMLENFFDRRPVNYDPVRFRAICAQIEDECRVGL